MGVSRVWLSSSFTTTLYKSALNAAEMTHHACVCVSVWTHCRCCSSTVEVRLCVLAGGGRGRWIAPDATENCLINIFISSFHTASVCEPGLSSWMQRHQQQIPSCTAAKMPPSRAGRTLSQVKEKSRSTHPSKPTRCSYCVHHVTNPSIHPHINQSSIHPSPGKHILMTTFKNSPRLPSTSLVTWC